MSLRLYFRIGELSDPIFGDAEEFQAGDHVRLYTRGRNDCVGEGRIMDYPGETWGTTGIFLAPRRSARGLTRRWVVRLETPNIRRASFLYPDENDPRKAPATAQIGERVGKLLLWEVVCERYRWTQQLTIQEHPVPRMAGPTTWRDSHL